ncbi:hypothetical protein J6590_043760 [Homalodisca vitripennis]|nr:hypothetical protein J6590_043760 [Homalodisca vitripennis]
MKFFAGFCRYQKQTHERFQYYALFSLSDIEKQISLSPVADIITSLSSFPDSSRRDPDTTGEIPDKFNIRRTQPAKYRINLISGDSELRSRVKALRANRLNVPSLERDVANSCRRDPDTAKYRINLISGESELRIECKRTALTV